MLVYYVPHVQALGGSPQAAELGRRWLAEHAREGIAFILVPTTRQASSNDVIRALTSSGVRWSIPRNFPPHDWPGGPVLAPWSDDKVLECIDRWSERITSVCILKWVEDSCRDWLTARGARDVTAPASEPLVPGIRDGVVLAAMEDITTVVNLANDLATGRDRTDAIRRLQYLRRWDHDLNADEIVPWALANGWSQAGVAVLRDIIERINADRSFRGLDWGPIRDRGSLLKRWEQRAGS